VTAVERVAALFAGQSTLVISHGGAIGTLERALGVKPERPTHLGGRWIEATTEGLRAGPEHFVFRTEISG
jgi:broad specificity phosphatase PhoE